LSRLLKLWLAGSLERGVKVELIDNFDRVSGRAERESFRGYICTREENDHIDYQLPRQLSRAFRSRN
jgi:hypothetical protein